MSLSIDLLLLEPARGVLYGLPMFVGDSSPLLRYLLRNHGEWPDNSCQWLASPHGSPLQIALCCAFNSKGGQRHARRLLPHLDATWHLVPPEQRDDPYSLGAAGVATRCFDTVWYAYRNAPIHQVEVASDPHLARQQDYWFPCDGAMALDISAWPGSDIVQPARLIERMVRHAPLIEVVRARAECCFLLHLQPGDTHHAAESAGGIQWHRERPLPGRQGQLIEARVDVPVDTPIRPAP
jgi:hypothetical protein